MRGTGRTAAPRAGLLSVDGQRDLVARQLLAPIPDIAPVLLASVARRVTDPEYGLVDWQLEAVSPAGLPLATLSAFSAWRRSWVAERRLGSLAGLRQLLELLEATVDLSAVRALLAAPVRIDPATCTRVARQMSLAGQALREGAGAGLGLFDPSCDGLLVGLAPKLEGTLLLSGGDLALYAYPTSLALVRSSPSRRRRLHALPTDADDVRSWELAQDAERPSGFGRAMFGQREVALDAEQSLLLAQACPRSAQVSVRPVALARVFEVLLSGLPAAAVACAKAGVSLHVDLR